VSRVKILESRDELFYVQALSHGLVEVYRVMIKLLLRGDINLEDLPPTWQKGGVRGLRTRLGYARRLQRAAHARLNVS